ncbi:translation initiation factor IF-5A [Candidatus Woesearchaeota archaeon]|nr:translation initiation factor IF-5A [Candidatus Woesearchaeota archaeon]
MADVKQTRAGGLQKGNFVIIEGVACKVVDTQISKPGKHGHSKCRLSAVGLIDDKKRVIVVPGDESMDVPVIDKRTAQVLSITGDTANVMDAETFETFDMKIAEELKAEIKEGSNILYWIILNDKVMKQIKTE